MTRVEEWRFLSATPDRTEGQIKVALDRRLKSSIVDFIPLSEDGALILASQLLDAVKNLRGLR